MSEIDDWGRLELPAHSRLYTIRLWCEDMGGGRAEWRGRVQNVTSGEVRYFRDWPGLLACLQEMAGPDPPPHR